MAISVKSLRDWLSTLNSEAAVAIDDGGLCLQECGGTAYLEVGGEVEPEEPSHNDEVLCCPDCEKPNQFGELCPTCANDAAAAESDRA